MDRPGVKDCVAGIRRVGAPHRVALLCKSRAPSWWTHQTAMGAEEVLTRAGCLVRIIAETMPGLSGSGFLRWLRRQGVDAAIDVGHGWSAGLKRPVQAWKFPVVYVGHPARPGVVADCTGCDESLVARLALDHLQALGHRHCGYLIVTDQEHTRACLANFEEEARRRGLWESSLLLDLRAEVADNAHTKTIDLHQCPKAEQFLRRAPKPLAIFCHNDYVGAALIEWLLDHDYAVPADVAVVGVDDDPLYALANVGLTTVATPLQQMGREAARLVVGRLTHRDATPCRVVLAPPRLVVRGSTVGAGGVAPWLQDVLQLLHESFDRGILVAELAEAIGWRRETLARRFRRAVGCTISEYRTAMRLEEAARLLRAHPELTVAAIGRKVGLAKASWFATLFRRHFGVGPGVYQRQGHAS